MKQIIKLGNVKKLIISKHELPTAIVAGAPLAPLYHVLPVEWRQRTEPLECPLQSAVAAALAAAAGRGAQVAQAARDARRSQQRQEQEESHTLQGHAQEQLLH